MSQSVHEGMVKKGGQNATEPTTSRPAPPRGSNGLMPQLVREKPVEANAVYVEIAPNAVASTEEIVPGRVFFDRCAHGHIIGVEVIGGKVTVEPSRPVTPEPADNQTPAGSVT